MLEQENMYSLDPNPTVRGADGKYIPDTSGKPRIIKHTFQFPKEKGSEGKPWIQQYPKYQRYLDRGYTFNKADLESTIVEPTNTTEPEAPLYVSDKDSCKK
ncbi:hypothetical protein LCGC14_1949270 [marine sediment metagenome]|uniref:Uncharacterized protein n=1 Tax=marine sediment metagenome TaxID=412755 RepID=A0A0F9G6A2_9ZZZZ